jgi:hypothetical protein
MRVNVIAGKAHEVAGLGAKPAKAGGWFLLTLVKLTLTIGLPAIASPVISG